MDRSRIGLSAELGEPDAARPRSFCTRLGPLDDPSRYATAGVPPFSVTSAI